MADLTESLVPPTEVSTGCFPYGFRRELKALLKLAWPTSLSIMFHQLLQPISLAFCGHLGETELAAVALAISVIYITTVSVSRGLAFGGDTFFAQTYGSRNKKKMGIYLQKAIIFGFLTSCFVCCLLLNTESLLLLARQPPDVSRLSQEYCWYFMPGAFAYCWLFTLMRYLLCQNRVIPNLVICVIGCGICSILHYGLIFQAQMGIAGSAIALMMTYFLVLFQLVGYIWTSGIYKETWGGWSWECMLDWGRFARVILSSILMTFIFWFYTEVGTFLAGLLSSRDISAFSIQWQMEGFFWMIPLGLGGACTARIGQYLGADDPAGALTSSRVTLTIQVFISIIMAALVYFPRHYIPMIFTSNQEIIDYTASIMPVVSLFVLLEGVGGVGVGIVRGTGRQTLGALILFIGGYVFSLPLGIPLTFFTSVGLAGLWWGNVLGLAMEDIFLIAFVSRLDWTKESQKAQDRAGLNDDLIVTVTGPSQAGETGSNSIQNADETTPLLTNSYSNNSLTASAHYESVNWPAVIALRIATFVFFIGLVVASYVLQRYVKVPVRWDELCINTNRTLLDVPMNVTLPPCNFSSSIESNIYFAANMRL